MKSIFERLVGLLLLCTLLSAPTKTKLVKGLNRFTQPENPRDHVVIKAKQPFRKNRKLTGEGEELNEELKTKKMKGIDFKNAIYMTLLEEIPQNIKHDNRNLIGVMDGAIWNYKGQEVVKMTLNLEEGDEFHEDFVEVFIENPIINFELSIEKTNYKSYVKEYLMFYVNKALYIIGQTINVMDDLKGDWKLTLSHIMEPYGGENTYLDDDYKGREHNPNEDKGKDERRLYETPSKEVADKKLKMRPVLGRIFMKDLDLKNKKYISQKPGVANYLETLKPIFEKKKKTPEERELKLSPDDLKAIRMKKKTLGPKDIGFQRPKMTSFKSFTLTHPILKEFIKTSINTASPVIDSAHILSYDIFVGQPNISDCRITLHFINAFKPIIIIFSSPSVDMIIVISVATKRYTMKFTKVGHELYVALLKIISNLTDLRVWADKYSDTTKFHFDIYDIVKPRILQMMFQEVFDNLTDGQTSLPGVDGQEVLHMDPVLDDDDSHHVFSFSKKGKKMLTVLIYNDELGPEFETVNMIFYYHDTDTTGICMGGRVVPSRSMYNQHYLLKRFIDFGVQLIVRSDRYFFDYKDDITPFNVDAYVYEGIWKIPQFLPHGEFAEGTKFSTEVIGANKLEPMNFGDRIYSVLCPVISVEFHDVISLVANKYVYEGAKFLSRYDIDYCSSIQNQMPALKATLGGEDNAEQERRLLEDNVSGHLV